MGVRVLTLARPAEWDDALAPCPASERDVYWSSAYQRAFEADGGRALLFVFDSAGDRLVYPFLLRPIERIGGEPAPAGAWNDVESAYGFSGPLATTADTAFLGSAWNEFDDWCRRERVIAEFVRFHPLLRNERFRPSEMATNVVRQHVVLDLTQTDEAIWSGYTKQNRNMIRKAERLGVRCEIGSLQERLSAFVELYHLTMDRNEAAGDYYFSAEHFRALAAAPNLLCGALLEGELVALSLFLLGEGRIHYHLSGCNEKGLRAAANNLILHTVVREAKRRGLLAFHFGGGRTGVADDALLRFKSGFSGARAPVVIGCRVHNEDVYRKACALRRSQVGVPAGFFLAYRYEPPPRAAAG
jgi:hypothetical protein